MRKNRENNQETSNIEQQTCVPLALATAFLTLVALHTCCLRVREGHPICHHQCDHPPSARLSPVPGQSSFLLLFCNGGLFQHRREPRLPGHTPLPLSSLACFWPAAQVWRPTPAPAPNLPDNRCDFWRVHASFSPGNGLIESEKCKNRSVIKNQLSWVPVSRWKTLGEGREADEQELGGAA